MLNRVFNDEKENISFFGGNIDKQSGLKHPSIQLLASANNQKKKQMKAKPLKNTTTNVRAGDWICLVCNNLNFSFRNECNRCQVQTKKQNYIQSLLLISDASKQDTLSSPKRLPLKDVTNHGSQFKSQVSQKNSKLMSSHFPQKQEYPMEFYQDNENGPRSFNPYERSRFEEQSFPTYPNGGFGNMLLVTPPKPKGNRDSLIFKEYFDSNQKAIPPYKSPEQLPSMSPMLRKLGQEEEAMLREMRNLDLSNLPSLSEQYRMAPNVRPFVVDDDLEKPMSSNFFMQSLNNQGPLDNVHFGSNSSSPEIQQDNSFFSSIMEGNEFSQINALDDFHWGEDENFKQAKERKSDWVCSSCGNLNYSFRKFCNRCQVIR